MSVLRVVGLAVAAAQKGAIDVMMSASEGSATVAGVVLGVDTHLDLHVAVALDGLGRRLGELTVPTTKKGYEKLIRWAETLCPVLSAGVEGTSSYEAGLARYPKGAGIVVMEVERPQASSSPAQWQVRPPGRRGRSEGGASR